MDTHTTFEPAAAVDRLITLTQARERLGISRSKLYLMLGEDALPQPVKIGRRCYFSEREIEAYIEALLAQRAAAGGAR
jgi:predicted DNA-binding transcriptional regulator AlpA